MKGQMEEKRVREDTHDSVRKKVPKKHPHEHTSGSDSRLPLAI